MKKITLTLSDEAEKVFNDLMYSLPKDKDGTGMCTQSEAICYALQRMDHLEQQPQMNEERIFVETKGNDATHVVHEYGTNKTVGVIEYKT
jgi:hypothetical protein